MKVLKSFFVVLIALLGVCDVNALELRGTTPVNVTSDTSVNAKNMAFDEARRQIVGDVLRQYVDVDAFSVLLGTANTDDLSKLISLTSIDGEQISDTAYSANITMVLDVEAAQKWLTENGVQNWLPNADEQDMFVVVANLSNRLQNWADLNKIAVNQNLNFNVKNITGNVVRFEMPMSVRANFTIAVRANGWQYADKDGVLNIWK